MNTPSHVPDDPGVPVIPCTPANSLERVTKGNARALVVWQHWPEELAREWLGIDLPGTSDVHDNVATLLQIARPLLRGACS